ncbi:MULTISPECIES: sulfatase [Proteiniphilum]|jgi:arylsulfatase A-like enzyme|uniref:sulfatase n=1 Tax=Proteiniphilum TaxID=294702 RepID=UPI001EEA9AEA|nr:MULTISPECIES: sulfatase [Proteiniphilum]ULB35115.1 sulfatase [Proteiniphilum propionicum]
MNPKKLFTLALVPLTGLSAKNTIAHNNRPNIILFMVDDMGWQDTSLPFWKEKTPLNERYHTPNMERLASQGMMFTQAYACSVSSPTRVSLMTGMNAARHRVTNWTLEKNTSTDNQSNMLQFPEWNVNGICQAPDVPYTYEVTSLPQLLKNNGYHTIHCGKAHWGAIDTPGENPHHFGFEVNIAGHAGGGIASYLGEENYGNRTDGKPSSRQAVPDLDKYWGTETFATEALTLEALKALDKAKNLGQPFFLYMSHYAIHIPVNRDKRFYQKYIDAGLSEKEAAYAALIEGMDKSLGDLMNWLEKNELDKNTIVIFMSDNGGFATDTHWRDAPLYTQNAPLNSGKGSAYEGGIREPMIVKWPGEVSPGTKCDDYLIIEDFFPTILDMAQVRERKTVQTVDGVSFMPMLEGKPTRYDKRNLYWNYPNLWGNEGPGIGSTCTVRRGDWKLIYYYETGKKELFNITNDIGETANRAEQNPRLVKKLSKELGKFLRGADAQRPSFKTTGKPCPWPDEVDK